jgi:3-phytase
MNLYRMLSTALLAGAGLTLSACSRQETPVEPPVPAAAPTAAAAAAEPEDPPLPTVAGLVEIGERFLTVRDPADNVDSVAVWHGPGGVHWLLATAKHTDHLLVYEAGSGKLLRKVGSAGQGPGQFERPNGVFVIDGMALVVERDNRRVQVLGLPDFQSLLVFGAEGEGALRKPYGLWAQRLAEGDYRVFVTDNYEAADDQIPPPAELGQRVKQYRLRRGAEGLAATLEKSFGATSGPGVLNIVESVWGDPAGGRLLLADEEQYRQRNIKVYDFEGAYAGQRVGAGIFHFQPEGIALYACADGSGWWFTTDQGKQENFFHLFDRRSLEYLGSFGSPRVLNTDGVWLTQTAMPGFPHGAFYAVHDDGNVAAFDLGEVLDKVGAKRCGG